jgi:hypothetical protein
MPPDSEGDPVLRRRRLAAARRWLSPSRPPNNPSSGAPGQRSAAERVPRAAQPAGQSAPGLRLGASARPPGRAPKGRSKAIIAACDVVPALPAHHACRPPPSEKLLELTRARRDYLAHLAANSRRTRAQVNHLRGLRKKIAKEVGRLRHEQIGQLCEELMEASKRGDQRRVWRVQDIIAPRSGPNARTGRRAPSEVIKDDNGTPITSSTQRRAHLRASTRTCSTTASAAPTTPPPAWTCRSRSTPPRLPAPPRRPHRPFPCPRARPGPPPPPPRPRPQSLSLLASPL